MKVFESIRDLDNETGKRTKSKQTNKYCSWSMNCSRTNIKKQKTWNIFYNFTNLCLIPILYTQSSHLKSSLPAHGPSPSPPHAAGCKHTGTERRQGSVLFTPTCVATDDRRPTAGNIVPWRRTGVTSGPHRTRQRCSGPVCDRPSAYRPGPSSQNRLQRRLEAVLTGRNGPGRARTVANRVGTALTGAVRTGLKSGQEAEIEGRRVWWGEGKRLGERVRGWRGGEKLCVVFEIGRVRDPTVQ